MDNMNKFDMVLADELEEYDMIDLVPVLKEVGADAKDIELASYEYAVVDRVEGESVHEVVIYTDSGNWCVPRATRVPRVAELSVSVTSLLGLSNDYFDREISATIDRLREEILADGGDWDRVKGELLDSEKLILGVTETIFTVLYAHCRKTLGFIPEFDCAVSDDGELIVAARFSRPFDENGVNKAIEGARGDVIDAIADWTDREMEYAYQLAFSGGRV